MQSGLQTSRIYVSPGQGEEQTRRIGRNKEITKFLGTQCKDHLSMKICMYIYRSLTEGEKAMDLFEDLKKICLFTFYQYWYKTLLTLYQQAQVYNLVCLGLLVYNCSFILGLYITLFTLSKYGQYIFILHFVSIQLNFNLASITMRLYVNYSLARMVPMVRNTQEILIICLLPSKAVRISESLLYTTCLFTLSECIFLNFASSKIH